MGWDAFSSANDKYDYGIKAFNDPILDIAFGDAVTQVLAKCGTVDSLLRMGALDCSLCAEMIRTATDIDPYGDALSTEAVKLSYKNSDWEFGYDKEEAWAYWSAYYFLKVCS